MPLHIAITALAVRTALGENPAQVALAVQGGASAIAPIEGFDASGFGEPQAAQIWREPEVAEDDPALRILGPHGRLLDAVALDVHAAAALGELARERVGLYVGMGMVDSPVEDLAPAVQAARDAAGCFDLATFFAGAYRQVHPLWPLSMLGNVAAGQVAIDLDLRGDNLVLASEEDAGARAILEAAWALNEGACDAALVAGVSGRITPAHLARRVLQGRKRPPGEGAAALVLERVATARARGVDVLGVLRSGASAFGAGARQRALAEAGRQAGWTEGGAQPSCVEHAHALGELGAAAAASDAALLFAHWGRTAAPGGAPRRALVVGVGSEGGACALALEEQR